MRMSEVVAGPNAARWRSTNASGSVSAPSSAPSHRCAVVSRAGPVRPQSPRGGSCTAGTAPTVAQPSDAGAPAPKIARAVGRPRATAAAPPRAWGWRAARSRRARRRRARAAASRPRACAAAPRPSAGTRGSRARSPGARWRASAGSAPPRAAPAARRARPGRSPPAATRARRTAPAAPAPASRRGARACPPPGAARARAGAGGRAAPGSARGGRGPGPAHAGPYASDRGGRALVVDLARRPRPAPAAEALDQRQGEVDPAHRAAGGDDVAVVDDARLDHLDALEPAEVVTARRGSSSRGGRQDAGVASRSAPVQTEATMEPAAWRSRSRAGCRPAAPAPTRRPPAVEPAAAGDDAARRAAGERAVGADDRAVVGAHLARALERHEARGHVVADGGTPARTSQGPSRRARRSRRRGGSPRACRQRPPRRARRVAGTTSAYDSCHMHRVVGLIASRSSRSTSPSPPRSSAAGPRATPGRCARRAARAPCRRETASTWSSPPGSRRSRSADTVIVPGIGDDAWPMPDAVLDALRARRGARRPRWRRSARARSCSPPPGCSTAAARRRTGATPARLAARVPAVDRGSRRALRRRGRHAHLGGRRRGDRPLPAPRPPDHGAEAANAVARRIVVAAPPRGGQAQFVERPLPGRARRRPRRHARLDASQRLDRPLTVEALARHAGYCPRTFARRFGAETGTTPLQWLIGRRVVEAQRLLEASATSASTRSRRAAGSAPRPRCAQHFGRVVGTAAERRTGAASVP